MKYLPSKTHLNGYKRVLSLACGASILIWIYYASCGHVYRANKKLSNLVGPKSKFMGQSGVPFVYSKHVDFRVIVLTFSRAHSLDRLLESLNAVQMDGHTGAIEIWIDVDENKKIDKRVLETSQNCSSKIGECTIHVQNEHVGIYGQWIDSWRPNTDDRSERKEIALILEDDMEVSPFVYRWLRSIHNKYGSRPDFAGASLNGGSQMYAHNSMAPIITEELAFMYVCVGTWGFSPSPHVWKDFQDWFHANITYLFEDEGRSRGETFNPYVPGTLPSEWYEGFVRHGSEDTMWEMWFIFYTTQKSLMTVYSNVVNLTIQTSRCPWLIPLGVCAFFSYPVDDRMCFGVNRQEAGLHFEGTSSDEPGCTLVRQWSDSFINLPEVLEKFDWWGNKIKIDP